MSIRAKRPEGDEYEATPALTDRTFLGGLRTGARAWLYFLACAAAAVAFGALFVYVDTRLEGALMELQRAQKIDELANTVERGTYRMQARQRQFLLNHDTTVANAFSNDVADVSSALDELFAYPEAQPLGQHVTTVRDGLVQYDQQFQTFLEAERAIGLSAGDGLNADLKRASAALRAAFRDTGNLNLVNQVEHIDQQGEETALSGSKRGVEEIRNRYDALAEFVASARMPDAMRTRVSDLLKQHETNMLSIINARFTQAEQAHRFEELVDYFVPSLTAIAGFADRERLQAAAEGRNAQLLGKYTVLGGTVAILLWLLFFGLLLIRSLSSPANRIAHALELVSHGASHVTIPAQGNNDAFGRIARVADYWADTVIETDQLLVDLTRTREQLQRATEELDEARDEAAGARLRAEAAEAVAKRNEMKALPPPEKKPTVEIPVPPERPRRASALDAFRAATEAENAGGAISSISQRLQNFSEYVAAAANDVERTESLIKGIDLMTQLVDDAGELVVTIRDQSNLLAFRSPGKDAVRETSRDDDNLIPFGGERGGDAERAYAQRFDHLRDATDRTERTVMRIKETLEDVSSIARDIAETASHQALDATNRLLSQSEYLQNMLDDIMNKIHPAKPGALSSERSSKRSSEDPFG